jgi:hypothetical protein
MRNFFFQTFLNDHFLLFCLPMHFLAIQSFFFREMLDLQHQYNNCTTIPHMRVGPTYWGPPSCEGLLYSCCIGIVQESNPFFLSVVPLCLSYIFSSRAELPHLALQFYFFFSLTPKS